MRKHAYWLIGGATDSIPFGEGVRDSAAPPSGRKDPTINSGGDCVSQARTSAKGLRWQESYSEEQAEHLRLPAMPRNPFRDAMDHRWDTEGFFHRETTNMTCKHTPRRVVFIPLDHVVARSQVFC